MVSLDFTYGEIRVDLITLSPVLTTHMNRCIEPVVNVMESTMTSILRDLVRINPPIFLGSKVEKIPKKS